MVILAIQKFESPRTGCCGAIRYDSIYPASDSLSEFIEEAKNLVTNYGKPSYLSDNDTYYFEYFVGEVGQEFRGSGDSIYKMEKKGSNWVVLIGDSSYTISDISDFDSIVRTQ